MGKDIFVVVPMTCVRHIFLSDSLLFSFWIVSLSLLLIFCTPNVVFIVLQMMISCFLYKKFFFFIGTMVANTVDVRFFPSFSITPQKTLPRPSITWLTTGEISTTSSLPFGITALTCTLGFSSSARFYLGMRGVPSSPSPQAIFAIAVQCMAVAFWSSFVSCLFFSGGTVGRSPRADALFIILLLRPTRHAQKKLPPNFAPPITSPLP